MIAVTGVNAVNPEGANQTTLQAAQLFGQLAQTQQRIAAQQAAQAFGATTDMMRMERQADLQMQQARDRAALNYGFESFDQLTQAAGEANQDVNTFLANLDADRQGVLAKQKLADDITRFQQTFPLEFNADYVRNEAQAASAALQAEIGKRLPFAPPEIQARVRTLMSERQSIMADSAGFELRGLDDVAGDLRANANEIAQALAPVQVPVDPMMDFYMNGGDASKVFRPLPNGGHMVLTGVRNGSPSWSYEPPEKAERLTPAERLVEYMAEAQTPEQAQQLFSKWLTSFQAVDPETGETVQYIPKDLNIAPQKSGGGSDGVQRLIDKIPLYKDGELGEDIPLSVDERVGVANTIIDTDRRIKAQAAQQAMRQKIVDMTPAQARARVTELIAKLRSQQITDDERAELQMIRNRAAGGNP